MLFKQESFFHSVVPALYNDLDASQDGTQYSQLLSEASQPSPLEKKEVTFPSKKQDVSETSEKASVEELEVCLFFQQLLHISCWILFKLSKKQAICVEVSCNEFEIRLSHS